MTSLVPNKWLTDAVVALVKVCDTVTSSVMLEATPVRPEPSPWNDPEKEPDILSLPSAVCICPSWPTAKIFLAASVADSISAPVILISSVLPKPPSLNWCPLGDDKVVVITCWFITVLLPPISIWISFSSPYVDCEIRESTKSVPFESYIGR